MLLAILFPEVFFFFAVVFIHLFACLFCAREKNVYKESIILDAE